MSSNNLSEIADDLATRDARLARLIRKVGSPKIEKLASDPFTAMIRNITAQQLNGAVAAKIFNRLKNATANDISPTVLAQFSHATLSALGLSRAKATCILELSQKTAEGVIDLTPETLAAQSDEEIIKKLCTVKGIGPWTVNMLLIFQLARTDVWPFTDLGVRKGYSLIWRTAIPTAKQLKELGDRFRPYRSLVAWYCWRATELKDDPDYTV